MRIRFNLEDDLQFNRTLQFYNKIIIVRNVFREGNKFYPKIFLDEYLYKLA